VRYLSLDVTRLWSSEGDVAGVVVNYNAREHLLNCVASLLGEGVEIVIVATTVRSMAPRPPFRPVTRVKWPRRAQPRYGAAADLGAALSDSTYLLVCNPMSCWATAVWPPCAISRSPA